VPCTSSFPRHLAVHRESFDSTPRMFHVAHLDEERVRDENARPPVSVLNIPRFTGLHDSVSSFRGA